MSLMIDLNGYELEPEEKDLLQHPFVSSVILFTRNYDNREQLCALVKSIKSCAKRPILIAVDQEGGRVQRFRQEFQPIPSMRKLAQYADSNDDVSVLESFGWLMASEVLSCGIDISFAPVLDLEGISDVIGERSFNSVPDKVVQYAGHFIKGMHKAGMAATGKHFPGHGSVQADTHHSAAIDNRTKAQIFNLDILPFEKLIQKKLLQGIMPAHVVYPDVDPNPAGFSPFWLKTILREKIGFDGVIFSDDLSMEGANVAGSYVSKASAAYAAGCDIALACNNRNGAIQILDNWTNFDTVEANNNKHLNLIAKKTIDYNDIITSTVWKTTSNLAKKLETN
ncbi:beta-N-acetylhexosaminidase [Catenovulum sediminis]|uniref:beta-N-acetylhexosaminidase n=1 Tax=Catenovulum sediminis TaxID=1740262 RepID=UPI00117CCB27|nr:beta-N-acetylhexosaminidase [Catenovulum sediminis]